MERIKTDIPDDKYKIMSNHELLKLGKNLDRFISSDLYSPTLEDPCLSSKQQPENDKNQVTDNKETDYPSNYKIKTIPMYSVINPKMAAQTKNLVHKERRSSSENIKTDLNMNAILPTEKKHEKDQILREREIHTLKMISIGDYIGVYLRDIHGDQVFSTQHIMTSQNHVYRHDQIVKSINFLPICAKTELTIPQIITNIAAKIHLCPVRECTQAFFQPSVAKEHTLKHLVIKPYSCSHPGCEWEFYKEIHLNRHMNTHEGMRRWVCDEEGCKKDFSTIYNLNEHKRKIHTDPATVACTVKGCQERFRNVKELRKHCKTHTDSEAPYQCNFENCTRSFFTETALETHCQKHSSTNQNVCNFPDCSKVCANPYRLKEHIRTHTGSRPYGCNFPGCKWRFMTSSKLQRHFKSHNKDKSYPCNVPGCNRSYRRNEHLRSHLQTHIQVAEISETTKCQFCGVLHISKSAHMKKYHQDIIANIEKLLGVTPGSNGSLTPFASQEAYASSNEIVKVGCQKDDKTEDEILKEAIKSLGVPELILSEEELMKEPLDLLPAEDFSTVNLKDLD